MTRPTCSLLSLTEARGLAEKAGDRLGLRHRLGEQELDRHPLAELLVDRGHHPPHSTLAEQPLDAVLAREKLAFLHAPATPRATAQDTVLRNAGGAVREECSKSARKVLDR